MLINEGIFYLRAVYSLAQLSKQLQRLRVVFASESVFRDLRSLRLIFGASRKKPTRSDVEKLERLDRRRMRAEAR